MIAYIPVRGPIPPHYCDIIGELIDEGVGPLESDMVKTDDIREAIFLRKQKTYVSMYSPRVVERWMKSIGFWPVRSSEGHLWVLRDEEKYDKFTEEQLGAEYLKQKEKNKVYYGR